MRIFANWSYKLAAVVIAFILWATAQGFRSVEQSIDVPISLEDVPEDVVVVEQSVPEVNVRLAGSRAALRRAAKEIVRYPISLQDVKPGEARIAVNLEAVERNLPRGAEIAARSPSTVVFKLEPRGEKTVPVRVDLVGTPPDGYRIGEVSVTPPRVTLSGSRRQLARIREVMTDRVDVTEATETLEAEVRVLPAATHVWLADGAAPVRVVVQIAPPEPPAPVSGGPPDEGGEEGP